jgi:hypothetical protein
MNEYAPRKQRLLRLQELVCWPEALHLLEEGERVPDVARF